MHSDWAQTAPDEAAFDIPRSTAPVDDLARSIAYYQKLGFTFGEPWDGFYAIGQLDGLELHLKEAPKDATSADTGVRTSTSTRRPCGRIEAFYAQCAANGVTIIKPLMATPWARGTSTSRTQMAISSASGVAGTG